MALSNQNWDRWIKVASVCCTAVVLPGIGWAFQTRQDIHELSGKVNMLAQQIESDRQGVRAVLEELRQLRNSVEAMRAEVLQRITRVETKVEQR